MDCADCDERRAGGGRPDQFDEQIFPVLTPLAVGPGRPFPYISNLSLSLAVWLRDPVSGDETFARVKVPKEVLPRFLPIGDGVFVPLEAVIARHLDELFPGMEILRHDFFRVTRDADFTVSDEADDLLRAVEDELRRRRFGEVVRLEVSRDDGSATCASYLVEQLAIEEAQVIDVEGLLDLRRPLVALRAGRPPRAARPALDAGARSPAWPRPTNGQRRRVRRHARGRPARAPPLRLVRHAAWSASMQQAVADPDVLAIKMTVYRTSDDSELVPSLIEAAERGKQAVCLVELKARFDERRNIGWARSLEEAGAHVVHGLPGLKTHAKALLVVRREGSGRAPLRAHRHRQLPRQDRAPVRGLRAASPPTGEIAADVAELFNTLTGAARTPGVPARRSWPPSTCAPGSSTRSSSTIEAHAGRARRRASSLKLNSLVDARCIRALYEASQAGVQVDLNVRGICCLRAGVPGVSENIRVVSVVGRFLEHSRVYGFWRGDERRYWMGSADLMPRNLDTRVELLVPIEDAGPARPRSRTRSSAAWPTTRSPGSSARTTTGSRRSGGTRSVQRELMRSASSARQPSRPSPSLRASTRAADSRTARGTAGERRACAQQPRRDLVPARAARSSGSGRRPPHRALRGRGRRPSGPAPPGASSAVGHDHAVEAEPLAQQAGHDRRRLRGDPVARRAPGRARARASRAARRPRRRRGTGPGRAAHAAARRSRRGRRRCSPAARPSPGKCLAVAATPAAAHALHRGAGARRDPRGVARRRRGSPSPARRRRARRPPARGSRSRRRRAAGRAAARAPRRTRRAGSPCWRLAGRRPGPGDGADLAALLVDHHERLAARLRAAPRR